MNTIYINGEKRKFKDGITIYELLEELDLSKDLIVVEVDGEIIPKENYSIELKKGNVIELVSFIGGG